MRFCSSCGNALEFFEFLDGELCSDCQANAKNKQEKRSSAGQSPPSQNFSGQLSDYFVCYEAGKLVIKSEEGWTLWSGSTLNLHRLDSIITQSERILKIRRKRQKN